VPSLPPCRTRKGIDNRWNRPSLSWVGKAAAGPLLGVGVLAIVLVGVTLLTITAGWVICEMFGLPSQGWPYRLACLIAAVGVAGPFLFTEGPVFRIVVPASILSLILLPLASATAMMMINCKTLLGDRMPRGVRRLAWNVGLGMAVAASTVFGLFLLWLKTKDTGYETFEKAFGKKYAEYGEYGGLALVGVLIVAMLIVHFAVPRNPANMN